MLNLVGPLKLNFSHIRDDLPTYFIDGGVKYRSYFSSPQQSFGDNDSAKTPLDVILPREKDYSDYLYTLKRLISLDKKFALHGLYGERIDHQLAIIGDTLKLLNEWPDKEIWLYTDKEMPIIFCSHRKRQHSLKGKFSLMGLETQKIHIRGAYYPPLNQEITLLPLSSFGISNFTTGHLEISANKPYILIPLLD